MPLTFPGLCPLCHGKLERDIEALIWLCEALTVPPKGTCFNMLHYCAKKVWDPGHLTQRPSRKNRQCQVAQRLFLKSK